VIPPTTIKRCRKSTAPARRAYRRAKTQTGVGGVLNTLGQKKRGLTRTRLEREKYAADLSHRHSSCSRPDRL
jgi:hypothetical protein